MNLTSAITLRPMSEIVMGFMSMKGIKPRFSFPKVSGFLLQVDGTMSEASKIYKSIQGAAKAASVLGSKGHTVKVLNFSEGNPTGKVVKEV